MYYMQFKYTVLLLTFIIRKILIIKISKFKIFSNFQVPLVVVEASVDKVRLNNEKLLIKKLTESYPQKFGRPLINDTDGPVIIKLRVQLIQIVKLVI